MNKTSWTLQQAILILIIIILPFNLLIGRMIPEIVFLPLYIIDIFILLLGIFLCFNHKRHETITSQQKYIVILLFLFFCLGLISILANRIAILQFVGDNSKEIVVHSIFKQIISDDPTQSINKTMQIMLSILLFYAVCLSSPKKEFLLKIACIPLVIIIITNLYLVINQRDVALDGGRVGATIHPYSIKEMGRAYFPFVNSLHLSMYLSLLFFVVLFLFLRNYEHKKYRILFFSLLLLLILTLGFTKSRVALITVSMLYLFLILFLYKKHEKEINSCFRYYKESRNLLTIAGVFLFIVTCLSLFSIDASYFFENVTSSNSNNEETPLNAQEMQFVTETASQRIVTETASQLIRVRELDKDTVKAGRMTLHWPTALAIFESEPFFGIGTGMFYYSVVDGKRELLCQQKELCPDFIQPTDISSTAHSIYLQVLAENGVVGFFLFIVLIISILLFGWKKISESKENNLCTIFLCVAILAFFIQGFFISYFEYREISYMFWLFVGMLLKSE